MKTLQLNHLSIDIRQTNENHRDLIHCHSPSFSLHTGPALCNLSIAFMDGESFDSYTHAYLDGNKQ